MLCNGGIGVAPGPGIFAVLDFHKFDAGVG